MIASNSALKSHVFLTRASSFILFVYTSAILMLTQNPKFLMSCDTKIV